jgi:hypothetical protein
MSAQTSQTSLLPAGHRNHTLFSGYALYRRAPELQAWREAVVKAAPARG